MRKKLKLLPLTLALFLTVGCSSTGPKGDKGDNGAQGIQGEPGQDGHTPVITIGSNGNWYVDGVDTNIQAQGTKGDQGDTGTQGEKGDTGNGVLSIEKTNTTGNVDTYTITYTNGEETTFTVTNGTNGEQGIQGVPGQDGHTPVITIGSNGNWYIDGVDTNIRAQGEKGDQGDTGPQGEKGEEGNGILSIEKTSTTGNVDTYTITYTNGEKTTFTVTNGTNGAQGIQGEPGQDGHTPVITIGSNGNWYIDGVDTNIRAQGEKGDKGDKGDTGAQGEAGLSAYEIYLKYYPEYTGTEKEWIDDLALGVLGEKYTIIWKNYDGTILEVDENVSRRAMVEYNGATPQRNNDDNYTFVGWTPKVEPATCNATYVASYESNTLPNWTIEMDSINTSAKVVSYTGTEENVVVPTSYLGKPVTSIDTNAFKDNTYLKSVVIGNSVTSIGNHAFSGCSSLTSVVIPDSVTSIVEWAFAYCSSLTSIVIPNSVTSIGSFVFYDCSSLTIYCEASSQPSGWISTWNYANRPVYWSGEWSYVNEVPTPNK